MPESVVTLTLDVAPFREVLSELESLAPELLGQVVQGIVELPDELVRLETEPTLGLAGELRVLLHPADRLLELVSAVRTGNRG